MKTLEEPLPSSIRANGGKRPCLFLSSRTVDGFVSAQPLVSYSFSSGSRVNHPSEAKAAPCVTLATWASLCDFARRGNIEMLFLTFIIQPQDASSEMFSVSHRCFLSAQEGKTNIKFQRFHSLACGVDLNVHFWPRGTRVEFKVCGSIGFECQASGKHFIIQGGL